MQLARTLNFIHTLKYMSNLKLQYINYIETLKIHCYPVNINEINFLTSFFQSYFCCCPI